MAALLKPTCSIKSFLSILSIFILQQKSAGIVFEITKKMKKAALVYELGVVFNNFLFLLAYIQEMKYPLLRNILLFILILFYLFAGANHFINPSFYLPIIPPYFFNWANEVNILSGVAEILLALLLIPKSTRSKAGIGIIIMLLAFIPSHIYFIQKGEFMIGSVLFNPLKSSIRLFVGQPLLILWAYWASKSQLKIIGF
jgi:uncharacterized membrane protein